MDDQVANDRDGRRNWLAALLLRQHERFGSRLAAALMRWRATPRGVRRRLGRTVALTAAGTALALSMVAGPLVPRAHAATITVDEATCTLVDAIIAANTDTATNGCVAGGGAYDTIDLMADVTLTGSYGYTYGDDTGLPLITSLIVLDGNGHTIARDGAAPDFRLMAVAAGGDLAINDATLTGGVAGNDAGGAVINVGDFYARDVTFTGNSAEDFGGAVANGGEAAFVYSTLSGNYADLAGGGVANYGGLMYAYETTFSGNYADVFGGGIVNVAGFLAVGGSTVSGNVAPYGGGMLNYGGLAYVVNSTVSENIASYGAGLASVDESYTVAYASAITGNYAFIGGGGVYNVSGSHTDLINTTISGNYTWIAGGGILNSDSITHSYQSTISNNGAYSGGGVYSNYLYVLGGAAEGATVGGALAGRQLDAAQRDRLRAMAPAGFNLDARAARLDGLTANGARPALGQGGAWSGAAAERARPDFRLDGSRLSGDVSARFTAALDKARAGAHRSDGHRAGGHHEGPGPDATAYYTTLYHSVVSGNWGTYGVELYGTSTGSIVSYDYNVLAHDGITTATALVNVTPSGTDFNAASDAGNVPREDIIDTTLAYNGGDTLNHALVSGSPAIDMLDHGLAEDQRGYDRPINGLYDSGSYEYTPIQMVYVSSDTSGVTDDAVTFGPHDVLGWNSGGWSSWFDGSAAGLMPNGRKKHNVNAIWLPEPDSSPDALVSFSQNARFVPGISGKVDGMDIVWWDGAVFTMWFDGQDVGLTNKSQEKVDALHVLNGWHAPDELQEAAGGCMWYVLMSTQGPGAVPGINGVIRFGGEDVLGFCMTQSGPTTKGKWTLVLNGTDNGMPPNSLANLSASDNGKTLYLMTRGAFSQDSAAGGHSMIYKYDFGGDEFSGPYWIAADEGLHEYVDALHVTREP